MTTKAARFLSTKDAARECGIEAQHLAYLFDREKLDTVKCPTINGRRIVPVDYLPTIRKVAAELAIKRRRKAG